MSAASGTHAGPTPAVTPHGGRSDDAEPRRMTPSERQHEALLAALHRATPASAAPSFKVAQVKAVGGATVYEWDVYVPVCDEFPTAAEAFKAACLFADDMRDRYPNGDAAPKAAGGPE